MSRRILIGIAGGSGSGKTLVARTIVRELGSKRVVVIDQDSYYRNLDEIPFRDREARNFDHPDAFDDELLRHHLRELLEGHPIDQPSTTTPSTSDRPRPATSAIISLSSWKAF
jgi:uridine kinase